MRLILVSLVALPLTALAADGPDSQPEIRYQERTELDFDTVDVNATLHRPAIGNIFETRRATFNPLIDLRQHFNVEMSSSLTAL